MTLPLETWRKIIGYNPWHFWGLAGSLAPVTSACNSVVRKYAWQGTDAAGREDILYAIDEAERKLQTQLGYAVAPHFVSETLQTPRYTDRTQYQLGYADPSYHWRGFKAGEGYIKAVGVEARTTIGSVTRSTPPILADTLVFSDNDGDGLYESFVATIATTVTNPEQIAIYFAAADRLDGAAVGEEWRISPVTVSISGGVATIRGKVWQLVKPIKYEGSDEYLNADDLTNYVSTLEVYRYFCDPTGTTTATAQGMLIWETEPYPGWSNCCNSANDSDPAALAYAIARIGIRDARMGSLYFGEAVYNTTTGIWYSSNWASNDCRPPDRITARYQAGYPLQNYQIDGRLATATARLAAAELARRICACDSANRELGRWQYDLAYTGKGDELYNYPPEELANPFGTRRGHIEAWIETRQKRNLQSFTVV
jgi:hypothetical protein